MKDQISYNDPFSKFACFAANAFGFQSQYGLALFNSFSKAVQTASSLQELTSKKIQGEFRKTFDAQLQTAIKDSVFSESLSELLRSYTDFASTVHHDKMYRYIETMIGNYDSLVEPVRDSVNRTPSEVVPMSGKFEIHHYKTQFPKKFKTPILVVGSLINRHYILDLLPETSVIRHFHQLGFDVYATDWRMPTVNDENMSLESYAHDYLEKAIEKVQEISGSKDVTLFGYCWGGILSLIYSTLHPENVRNLILHATPTDFGKKPTVLESWIKHFDVKKFVKTFGNVPSSFLNVAFILRNPLEASLKYYFYFSQPRTAKEIVQFFAVESWLYDSVPIIGKAFEQIIQDIYKNNLLIQNKMVLDKNPIDLKKIIMPILNIVGTNDDLVSAESSRTIIDVVSSKDKKTLEFPTGHVGLCISKSAHKKLWPQVGKWLTKHS
ncbi:alpha/beta fold hydrolase [Nitrosopumilus sp.]|uniref:alpha/beta fold hydrolase n=1 Tax=Nitrosopumilus sp. TaxID=2024843 RepID=UPI00349FDD3D